GHGITYRSVRESIAASATGWPSCSSGSCGRRCWPASSRSRWSARRCGSIRTSSAASVPCRSGFPDQLHARRKGLLQQPYVTCDRDEVVAHAHEAGGLLCIDGEAARRLSVLRGSGNGRLLGLGEGRVVPRTGLVEGDRQIVVTE